VALAGGGVVEGRRAAEARLVVSVSRRSGGGERVSVEFEDGCSFYVKEKRL
jgi:hypothetical protein